MIALVFDWLCWLESLKMMGWWDGGQISILQERPDLAGFEKKKIERITVGFHVNPRTRSLFISYDFSIWIVAISFKNDASSKCRKRTYSLSFLCSWKSAYLTSQSVISQETQTSHPILIQGYLICTKIAARSPRLTHTCDSLVWEFIVLNSPYLNFIG